MAVMMESFQRRIKLKNVHRSPGVGDYDLIKSMDFAMVKTPSYKIGTSHRDSIENDDM